MNSTDALVFESRDTDIFSIPDTTTKLNTLQNYFFPRLKKLVDMAMLLIKEVYQVDPFEKYSFVYRPSHRKNAKINLDYDEVYIGIAGKRNPTEVLNIKRPDGGHYSFHPSYLYFKVLPTGEMYTELLPFRYYVDEAYIQSVKQVLLNNFDAFSILTNIGKFTYNGGDDFDTVKNMLGNNDGFSIASPSYFFPIENQSAIYSLILSFVLLFPILDSCYDLAKGDSPNFETHFTHLKEWLCETPQEEDKPQEAMLQLPELDSYKFVRAGLWYQVLARDNWTCCSCRRSAKEHGIVLQVDHILPRSLGGRDELANLQTLCRKCNIGKSNKDSTDLRG